MTKAELELKLSKFEIEFFDFYATIHTCIIELFCYDVQITDINLMNRLYDMIPKHLLIDAMQWNIGDTEVRDSIYLLFESKSVEILSILKIGR